MIRNLSSLQLTLDEMTANRIESDVPFDPELFAKLSGQAQRLASQIGMDWSKADKAVKSYQEIMKGED